MEFAHTPTPQHAQHHHHTTTNAAPPPCPHHRMRMKQCAARGPCPCVAQIERPTPPSVSNPPRTRTHATTTGSSIIHGVDHHGHRRQPGGAAGAWVVRMRASELIAWRRVAGWGLCVCLGVGGSHRSGSTEALPCLACPWGLQPSSNPPDPWPRLRRARGGTASGPVLNALCGAARSNSNGAWVHGSNPGWSIGRSMGSIQTSRIHTPPTNHPPTHPPNQPHRPSPPPPPPPGPVGRAAGAPRTCTRG